jgi:hypothetical protein
MEAQTIFDAANNNTHYGNRIVKMWHFGVDSIDEYTGDVIFIFSYLLYFLCLAFSKQAIE